MALCERPYIIGAMPCACYTCDVCRVRRKRLWSSRIMLESYKHGDNAFLTLTYDDAHLPKDGSLNPKHVQDWLKRFRLAIYPRKMRFFLAGEYGDKTWRPHYHVAAFGVSVMDNAIVQETWNAGSTGGFTMTGTLTPSSAAYVAGYVTKKMTKPDDVRLAGRYPEFIRMSLKPGIGADAMADFARALVADNYEYLLDNGDVPFQFRDGKNLRMFGNYLRRRLRKELGYEDTKTPRDALQKFKTEMLQLLRENVSFKAGEPKELRKQKIMDFFLDRDLQKLRNVKARSQIFVQNKSI